MSPASGRRKALYAVAAVLCLGAAAITRLTFSRPAFDPDTVAAAETKMWQAYYKDDKTQLAIQLVQLLRNQFGLSVPEAKEVGERLAASAMTFHSARGNYEELVLPGLIDTYAHIRDATGGTFDPDTVARAELAWWVARRTRGQNSPQQVGEKIGELYVLLYGTDIPSLHEAGQLRAQAAALRDAGGKQADWQKIGELLRQSYRKIAEAGKPVS